jgi:hypothetical protein
MAPFRHALKMTLRRCCLAFLTLLLVRRSDGAAPANATIAIERLREFLPDAETGPEPALREELPARYSGKSTLLVTPEGRYHFFQWSETGPVTRNSDTGPWSIRDGFVELEAGTSNIVIKDAPLRFLAVKLTSYRYPHWFLIEVSQEFDRLLTAEAELRMAKGEKAALRPELGPSPAQFLLESRFSLRGGFTLPADGEVAEALNRTAAAQPAPTNRLADFIARAKRFIPTITVPAIRRPSDIAGEYSSGWITGGHTLYLLPDGGYCYVLHSDVPIIFPVYGYGTWSVRDNIVELTDADPGKRDYFHPSEKRFFVIRAPSVRRGEKREAQRLHLVGTNENAGNFLSSSAGREAAILTDLRTGGSILGDPSYRLGSNALTFGSAISARKGVSLRREFDIANLQAATPGRVKEEFKLQNSESDFTDKTFIFTSACDLTVDGIHFFCERVEADIGPATLKLSGIVRAEAHGSIQTLPATTLYLDGTKITGAAPAFEVGGRKITAPAKRK